AAAVPAPTPPPPAPPAPAPAVVAPPVTATAPAPPSPALPPVYPISAPPTDAELRARNLPALGGAFEGQAPILTPRQQAETELAALEGSYSGWLGATGIGRYRSGTVGLDRLNDVEAPAEASAVIGKT